MVESARKRRWLKNLIGLLLLPVLGYGWLRWFEHKTVFQPTAPLDASGDELGFPREDVWLDTPDGGRIHGWYFPGKSGAGGLAFLLCHGNGGNISHRLDQYDALLRLGVAVLAFDYRGYGRSSGSPSETKANEDAATAYDWLRAKGFAAGRIVVHGESLGGGVAANLAAKHPVGGLVLQSTYTSVTDLGAELFPWLPVRTLGRTKFEVRSRLAEIRAPVLVLHSRDDTIIPFHHGQRNFAAANEPKLFHELQGDHNDSLATDREAFVSGIWELLNLMNSLRKGVVATPVESPNAGHAATTQDP